MELIDQLRAEIAKRLEERNTLRGQLDEVIKAPADEKRNLNDGEAVKFAELRDGIRDIDQQIDDMTARVEELRELKQRNEEREKLALELQPNPSPQAPAIPGTQARITDEPLVYRQGGESSFFMDAYAFHRGMAHPDQTARLQRHSNEVRMGAHGTEFRDVGTGAFASLVVPQYLPEMYAEYLRAGRVTANLATAHDLPPEGMTMTIPRGVTGTVADAQTGENMAVTNVNFDADDLVVNVRTYAGQQDISRQAIERGRGVDEIIYADLAGSYAVSLNRDVINGPGTGGRHLGILGTTGVISVTSSVAGSGTQVMRMIADGIQRINSSRFLPPDVIVMHPRRWAWLTVQTDGNHRPLVVAGEGRNQPQNAFGSGPAPEYGFTGGQIQGLPVFTDAVIPTTVTSVTTATQDVILVMRRTDLHLWEDNVAPRQFRFEETLGGNLTIKLVIAGYSAFTAGHHPEGIAWLSGTPLITPTF